mmetsp:Transcript_17586/g.24166  ORF Transcript_17586/g.24166 Transcript_17586/m.24166 type:complete len:85 (-) Transcript_17586:164-418(-)
MQLTLSRYYARTIPLQSCNCCGKHFCSQLTHRNTRQLSNRNSPTGKNNSSFHRNSSTVALLLLEQALPLQSHKCSAQPAIISLL